METWREWLGKALEQGAESDEEVELLRRPRRGRRPDLRQRYHGHSTPYDYFLAGGVRKVELPTV